MLSCSFSTLTPPCVDAMGEVSEVVLSKGVTGKELRLCLKVLSSMMNLKAAKV